MKNMIIKKLFFTWSFELSGFLSDGRVYRNARGFRLSVTVPSLIKSTSEAICNNLTLDLVQSTRVYVK